jgi:hypothetical protein
MSLLKNQKVRRKFIIQILVYTLYVEHSLVLGCLRSLREATGFHPVEYPSVSLGSSLRVRSARSAYGGASLHERCAQEGLTPGWGISPRTCSSSTAAKRGGAPPARRAPCGRLNCASRQMASRGRRGFLAYEGTAGKGAGNAERRGRP